MRGTVLYVFKFIAYLVIGLILITLAMSSVVSTSVFGKVDAFLSERIDFNAKQWGGERIEIYNKIFGDAVEFN